MCYGSIGSNKTSLFRVVRGEKTFNENCALFVQLDKSVNNK